MALHALDDVDDALDVTRTFLGSLDRTAWVKLALVALFIGGPGANVNSFQYTFGGDGGTGGPATGVPPGDVFGPNAWLLVAGVVGFFVLLGLAFALVGSVMEFVFVESLRNESVTVRRYWGRRWKQGVRLFGFRLLVGFFVFGTVALFAAPFLLAAAGFEPFTGGVSLAVLLVVLLPLFVVLAVVAGLVNGFTTVFVVPIMILDDCGVLAGWRRLWATMTRHWVQYLAYAVASFFLSIVGGILVAIVTVVFVVVLLVPFGLLFALGIGLVEFVAEPVGIAVFVLAGLLFGLAVLAVAALVQVPVQAYLRYYAMLVLGDVDETLDLVPTQRAAVRGSPDVVEE
ncbi:hypothetical protein SAMN04487947_2426 [Halogeometricum rufum]|uniref:Membrane domain of glycerophosphoryl diester phosphodiesterase n=1 Tax=Halogeometricum rufum TaxID=553469 RepID=A0A1I6HSE7_9EURY|nr:hypothetical protein [Halogeometricum rufum]SFR57401.1 hypothetical protein SAMN04487947_2426 [Halogeometricum rufum]